MSNPESFINEVTEEVRRDRLYAALRKYGWIGVVGVLAIVGGTAWTEYRNAQNEAKAQEFGDAIFDALDMGAPEDRRNAMAAAPAEGTQLAIRDLLLASDPVQDRDATLGALASLAADPAQPQTYRDLAILRRVIVAGADLPLAERRTALESIAIPGRAFRTLALEQMAYLQVEEGKTAEAISALQAVMQDQEAPLGLRRRAEQMIVALGGAPNVPTAPGNAG